eukprot:5092273-Pyramimonas_sp.AAC.1
MAFYQLSWSALVSIIHINKRLPKCTYTPRKSFYSDVSTAASSDAAARTPFAACPPTFGYYGCPIKCRSNT